MTLRPANGLTYVGLAVADPHPNNPSFKLRLSLVGSFPQNWRDQQQPEEARLA